MTPAIPARIIPMRGVIVVSVTQEPKTAVSARTLNVMARCVERLPLTRKRDLAPGDCVIVSTKNSVYRLQSLGGNLFHATGGWFDLNASPCTVTVTGCTFGGSAICTEIVAAIGLFLEFGNKVSTTRIQDVRVLRLAGEPNRLLN